MYEMTASQIVQFTAGLCGGMYSLILFGIFWLSREKQDLRQRYLSWIFLIISAANFSEVFLALFSGKISALGFFMTRTNKFVDLLFSTLMVIVTAKYIACILGKQEDEKVQRWIRAMHWTWVLFLGLMFLNIFYPVLYHFDALNQYQRYTNVWIGYAIYISWGIMLLAMLKEASKDAPVPERWVSFFILLTLCITIILQSFVFSMSVINAVLTIAMSIIYMFWQVYHERAKNREIDEAHKKMEELQHEIEEASMRVAVSQLKPHFMYNTLISIRYLIEEDPDKAIEIMDDFMAWSRSLVTALDQKGLIPLSQEMEYTMHYMRIQQFRFDNRIQFSTFMEEEHILIPPLSVMTIVENSISHGIRKKRDGRGCIEVRSCRFGDQYLIRVIDDGVGFDLNKMKETSGIHTGLKNIRRRLNLLRGGELKIESEPGKGTVVTMLLPVEGNGNEYITG